MFAWIIENIATIIVSLILIAIVALIVVKLVSDKKKGKSSCGGNCSLCAGCSSCHKK